MEKFPLDDFAFRSIMLLYSEALNSIIDELVQCELQIEQQVLDRLGKYSEVRGSKIFVYFFLFVE